MSILYIIGGFLLLVIGGEFTVRASVGLSLKLNLSRMIIGLTVVSFATSAPELLVSLNAAVQGYSDIALGNVIGSNIANIGLILAITAIITKLPVDRGFFKLHWPVMILFSLALYLALINDAVISIYEGIGFLLGLLFYLGILIKRTPKGLKEDQQEQSVDHSPGASFFKIFLWLTIGAVGLYFGSELLVSGASDLATSLGASTYAISVSVIAIGTSVPELAASVIAAFKKEEALSLGNLIGSNIFNIGSVLGITAIISPISALDPSILDVNMYWMIGFAIMLLPLAFLPEFKTFNQWKGLLLFAGYCVFIGFTFF